MERRKLYSFFEENGLRLTQGRRGMVRVLSMSRTPLSAKEILKRLRGECRGVNKTTVYRELERWERLGLVQKVRVSEDEVSYELKRDHHHHLVCLSCERIEEVRLDEKKLHAAEISLNRETNFRSIEHRLEFFGICARCQP